MTWRVAHKWTAIVLAPPLLFLTLTGIFLQVRAEVSWIQPPVADGSMPYQPTVPMETVLEAAMGVPEMEVSSWADIQMLDLRPEPGIVKIRTWKEMETQIDASTGAVLSVNQRLNDIVAAMHDGSRWGLRLWVGGPVAVLTLIFLAAGIVLVWRQTFQKLRASRQRERKRRLKPVATGPATPLPRGPLTFRRLAWQWHYWLSLVVLIPWVVVGVSGFVLQLRDELPGVIPPRAAGVSPAPTLPFTAMYDAARAVPASGVRDWNDVWRIYYYPQQGTASVMVRHGARPVETQIDFNTGSVLDVSVRTKDLLEDLHEGKFYNAHLWWFLPAHLVALVLWLSGVMMSFGPATR